MNFIHEDPDFKHLLAIVAKERGLTPGLVEKDYWVTHCLWALHQQGLDVWFKGGTSLSKGFQLIERFSEDLDLKLEGGTLPGIPAVSNWKSEGTKATGERQEYFTALAGALQIPGVSLSLRSDDQTWRCANIHATYPGQHLGDLGGVMRPYVLLEIGSARVTPSVPRDMTSFVHDALEGLGQLSDFRDNRPKQVRCVHPFVTLLEKLEAIQRHAPNAAREPSTFVRHYEDAARIIRERESLPPLDGYSDVNALFNDMRAKKDVKESLHAAHPSFSLTECERTDAIRKAHVDIQLMFWGARIQLEDACADIREWLRDCIPPLTNSADSAKLP